MGPPRRSRVSWHVPELATRLYHEDGFRPVIRPFQTVGYCISDRELFAHRRLVALPEVHSLKCFIEVPPILPPETEIGLGSLDFPRSFYDCTVDIIRQPRSLLHESNSPSTQKENLTGLRFCLVALFRTSTTFPLRDIHVCLGCS